MRHCAKNRNRDSDKYDLVHTFKALMSLYRKKQGNKAGSTLKDSRIHVMKGAKKLRKCVINLLSENLNESSSVFRNSCMGQNVR